MTCPEKAASRRAPHERGSKLVSTVITLLSTFDAIAPACGVRDAYIWFTHCGPGQPAGVRGGVTSWWGPVNEKEVVDPPDGADRPLPLKVQGCYWGSSVAMGTTMDVTTAMAHTFPING